MDGLFAAFARIEASLTPERRRRIYHLAVIVGGILLAHQLVDAESLSQYLAALGILLGTAAPAMAARNTPRPLN